MQAHELDGLSWVATPVALESLPAALLSGLSMTTTPLDQRAVRASCVRDDHRRWFASANGWTFAFGFQLGLGGVAAAASKACGVALAFENHGKRGVRLCGVYRDGSLVRQVSHIQGDLNEEGAPLPGEPTLGGSLDDSTVEALARAWGADVSAIAWGTPAVCGTSRVTQRWSAVVIGLALLLALVFGLRALPSRAERCRASCERSWRATLAHTPECRGQVMGDCAFYREAAEECAARCR